MCRKLVINTVLNPWLALLSLAQEIVYFTPFTVRSILHVINQLYLASIWVSFFFFSSSAEPAYACTKVYAFTKPAPAGT